MNASLPFRLLRRIAVGGMGEVFLAEWLEETPMTYGATQNASAQVALKRILPHLTEEREFVDRFVDEARLMIRLRHPNLLPVYELRQDQWGLYMVMEHLDGYDVRSICRLLKHRELTCPAPLAVWITLQVAEGLEYAHTLRDEADNLLHLVHRDVSPSNILIGQSGEVKLIDFGVARAQGGIHQSVSGALRGKLAYMSPEQAQGLELDASSDLFSLGVTLYELLSGQRPRTGETDAELLREAQSGDELDLARDYPYGDPELIDIVNQIISTEPRERYSSAGLFASALRTWLERHLDDVSLQRGEEPSSQEPLELDQHFMRSLSLWIRELTPDERDHARSLNQALELQLLRNVTPPPPASQHSLGNTREAGAPEIHMTVTVAPPVTPLTADSAPNLDVEVEAERTETMDNSVTPMFSGLLISSASMSTFEETLSEVFLRETSDGEVIYPEREVIYPENIHSSGTTSHIIEEGESSAPSLKVTWKRRASLILALTSLTALFLMMWRANTPLYTTTTLSFVSSESAQEIDDPTLLDALTVDHKAWKATDLVELGRPFEVCLNHPRWAPHCQWFKASQAHKSTPLLIKIRLDRRGAPNLGELFERPVTSLADMSPQPQLSDGTDHSPQVRPKAPKQGIVRRSLNRTRDQGKLSVNRPRSVSTSRSASRRSKAQVRVTTDLPRVLLSCVRPLGERYSKPLPSTSYELTSTSSITLSALTRCEASAKHYMTQSIRIPDLKRYKVTLEPEGYISVRVYPPAAKVWLDGAEIKNPSERLTVRGREHQLLVRYGAQNEVTVERRSTILIEPGGRSQIYLDLTRDLAP